MSSSPNKTSRSAWKKAESRVAKFHGLRRNPLSGANSGRVGDAYDPNREKPWVYIENKLYARHAAVSLLRDHRADVMKVDHTGIPIVTLMQKGQHGFTLVIHERDIIAYSIGLLNLHGYKVTMEGDENATHNDGRDKKVHPTFEGDVRLP